jgi:DNA-binding beta-propeller fold protein YncE
MMKPLIAAIFTTAALAWAFPAGAATSTQKTHGFPVVAQIPAGDAFWDYAAFVPEDGRVYISREDGVTAIEVATGKVTRQLIAGKQVHAFVPLPKGRALITNGGADTAVILSRADGKVIRTIATGRKPDGAGLDPSTGEVLVMDGTSDDILFIDPASGAVLGKVATQGEPGGPVFDGHGLAFLNIADKSEIAVVDVKARRIVKTYPLPDCGDASGIGLDRATGVILSTCNNLKAVATDSKTGRSLGSVPISKYPDAIIFDPIRHYFYVPCVIPGVLVVVGEGPGRAPRVVASVPVALGVHTGAVDAKAGRLYLPAGDIRIPHTPGARPTVAPGTFKVMVVDVDR